MYLSGNKELKVKEGLKKVEFRRALKENNKNKIESVEQSTDGKKTSRGKTD